RAGHGVADGAEVFFVLIMTHCWERATPWRIILKRSADLQVCIIFMSGPGGPRSNKRRHGVARSQQ
ncbi:MAG TPA: hypothetical protein VI232_14390, partial [Reyranella sp.]